METLNIEKFGQTVESPTDYVQLVENIFDSYTMGLAHGLQKDAIQNGADAKEKKTKWKNWSFKISLIENKKKNFIILEDRGTMGLTGKLTARDVKNVFPAQDERWARFESFAFAKKDKSNLGARGQGKLIMFRASQSKTLVYDSLRIDGTYRLGMSQISATGRRVISIDEGKKARKSLYEICGLTPLSHVGTRVIILEPEPEIIRSIEDGTMLSHVEDTWWPIIACGGKITISARNAVVEAQIPLRIKQLRAKKKGENPNFKVSRVPNHKFAVGRGHKQYTIKDFVIGYDANGISAENQGISIFRGGMKIENYRVKTELHSETGNIYGYVICDKKLDEALRENELPSHYGFGSKTGVYAKLAQEIEMAVADFARKELKVGVLTEVDTDESDSATFKDAMRLFADVIKDLHLFGPGSGPTPPPPPPPPPGPVKPISLTIEDLKFPNPTLARVNYGDKLENFRVGINNKSIASLKYELIGKIKQGTSDVITLESRKGTSTAGTKIELPTESQKAYSILINKDIFTAPGIYTLEFQLLDNESSTKQQQAVVSRTFYVQQDPPPLKGPFNVERVDFSKSFPEMTMRQSLLQRAGDDSTLYINITHEAYSGNAHIEITLKRYLALLYTEAALQISVSGVISGDVDPKKISAPFDLQIMAGNDPMAVLREYNKAMGFFANKIYSSRIW